jgi:hypothetical protein
MSNPTTPFNWQMPTATDLVTDLPADFAVFGQAVATSMADLLGGTTGQILAKNSATDMDFVWIANDQGDITGITAGTGITVTSPTGPVPTVAIDTAVTVDKTTAQTLTNKTLTSPALTTPTISTATTNGDLLYGTGSGALARLGIGSSAQVLTVAGGVPTWATPASTTPTDVGCSIYKSGNVTIADSTETLMTFNSEAWDTDGFHSTTTNTGRITIPTGKGGKYLVVIREYIQSNTSGQRLTRLQKNGSVDWTFTNPPVSGGVTVFTLSLIMSLVATDYISYNVLQTSGGSLDYLGGTEGSIFQVTYLGA